LWELAHKYEASSISQQNTNSYYTEKTDAKAHVCFLALVCERRRTLGDTKNTLAKRGREIPLRFPKWWILSKGPRKRMKKSLVFPKPSIGTQEIAGQGGRDTKLPERFCFEVWYTFGFVHPEDTEMEVKTGEKMPICASTTGPMKGAKKRLQNKYPEIQGRVF